MAPFAMTDIIMVGPNAAHTTIQSAIDVASDGDVIRCAPGQYLGFTISNKALTILAHESSSPPCFTSGIYVQDTAVNKPVFLSNLAIDCPGGVGGNPIIKLENCAGPIRISHVQVLNPFTAPTTFGGQGPPSLDIQNCSNVSVNRSRIEGFRGSHGMVGNGNPGAEAVLVNDSKAAFSECYMRGGDGGEVVYCCNHTGGVGGRGLFVSGTSEVFLARCALIGGHWGNDWWGVPSGPDALGLLASGPNATVRSRGGIAFTFGGKIPVLYSGQQPTLATRDYLEEESPLAARITGTPGARVGLYFGTELAYNDQVIVGGPLLVATPGNPHAGVWRFLGTMPASGEWTGTFPTVDLPILTHTTIHMMAVTVDGSGRFYSNSASTVLVDAAW